MKPILPVFGIAVLLLFWSLGGHDLWAPDEPYFSEGAREMIMDGEWWVPHVNGVVTTDKPPLFFWLIALMSLPFGEVTPWTARLPSALAALGSLYLVVRMGKRIGGERVAWMAALILATTLMFWQKARAAQIDSLLCVLIWVGLSAFEEWRAGKIGGRRAGLVFWLVAGLAVLAKGPVGLLLPLGIALATLITERRIGEWKRFAPLAGPLLFVFVVGAWMVAATLGSGGEYSVWGALKEHFVDRGLHGLHHRQPPWYYLEVLPLHLLPWSGLVPGALLLAWRRRDQGDRFLLTTVIFVVVFFSISTEKRDLYILPAVPAFALLAARLVDVFFRSDAMAPLSRRWLFRGQAAVGTILMVAGVALPVVARGREEIPLWMAVVLGVIFVVSGSATLYSCRRSFVFRSALAPSAGFMAAYLFVVTFVFPALEDRKSARPFSLKIKAATSSSSAAGHQVVAYDLGNLPEAFAFYTDGVYTTETVDPEVLIRHLAARETVWAVINRAVLVRLPSDVRDRLVVVGETRLSRRDVLLIRNR